MCWVLTTRANSNRSTDLLGAIAAEAGGLADGDDARFLNDLALRLND